MPDLSRFFPRRIQRLLDLGSLLSRAREVARLPVDPSADRRVLFFNASTRISGLSQNAAFSLLASWAVRLAGGQVVHFVCRRGMSRCVLGTDELDPTRPMPCTLCLRQSRANTFKSPVAWFSYQEDASLLERLLPLSLGELLACEQPLPSSWSLKAGRLPLGAIVLPSLRWRLRLQTLQDDEPTRFLCRQFMLSAWNVAREFMPVLGEVQPAAVVLFNGTQFPEATVAWLCQQRGVRMVSHESGFYPYSGYFAEGQVTRYPIEIPDAPLTPAQNARLDNDLEDRWQGDFTMAGVKFWHEIHELPAGLVAKASAFQQVVSIFTNVIFDTSQLSANILFSDMFAWLDALLPVIRAHPHTLFILRAHPDEARPGKASRESVAMWVERAVKDLPNLVFIPPQERLSSYDLVRMSKFVLIYNSTIGMEAILLGVPVLNAAHASFAPFGIVNTPPDQAAYFGGLSAWLAAEKVALSPESLQNARRFIYHRTYRFSLPFGEFIESTPPTGYVRLKKFPLSRLAGSATARALQGGIFSGKQFVVDD